MCLLHLETKWSRVGNLIITCDNGIKSTKNTLILFVFVNVQEKTNSSNHLVADQSKCHDIA